MVFRSFLTLLALTLPSAFGQVSLYGPITAHPIAGDIAPDIVFTKILRAPDNTEWSQSNLAGRLTILVFSFQTSQNPQIVTLWNKLIDEFAGKPVQFLMVSGDQESTLLPWLNQHPIKGWVFDDPDGKTGNAYGLEEPATVFIGADGKIIGFGFGGFPPQDAEVNAALEGRITTKRPSPVTMKAFLESGQMVLNAAPFKFPRADKYKPEIPPSYVVHISPSQSEEGGNFGADDFKVLRRYTLKDAISDVYGVNPIRISLPASLDDDKRYDFSILLPQPEGHEKINARMKQGLEDYFHIVSTREERMKDVYVVTAEPGHTPPLVKREGGDEMGAMSGFSGGGLGFETTDNAIDGPATMKPVSLGAVKSVSFAGPADQFTEMLERDLDRPVIDETHWEGEIEIRIDSAEGSSPNDFLQRLRHQYGLVVTSEQRNIETVVFDLR